MCGPCTCIIDNFDFPEHSSMFKLESSPLKNEETTASCGAWAMI